jgi:hypothetical protein
MIPIFRGLILTAVMLPALAAHAQTAGDPWAPFLGCWTPVETATLGSPPITCVLPVSGAAMSAQILTVRGGATLRNVTVRADGTQVPVEDELCTGWESASFSTDGARLYLSGETRCGETPPVRTSGLFAILPNGDWLDVSGARTEAGERLQVERSRIVPWFDLPESVVEELEPLMRSAGAARLAAGRTLRVDDVIDVAGRVEPGVAEVWIAEVSFDMREDAFRVNSRDLRVLAAARVPGRVIDMLVAVANPGHYTVAVSERGVSSAEWPRAIAAGGDSRSAFESSFYNGAMHCGRMNFGMPFAMSPWAFNGFFGFPLGMNSMLFDCFGGSPLAFDARYGLFGWSRAGMYSGFFPGYGGFPIRVTVGRPGESAPSSAGGRVIRGRGYSEGTGTGPTTGTAQPRDAAIRSSQSRPRSMDGAASTRTSSRPASPSTRTSTSGSSSGSSSSGSASSGSSSSSSSGRTAKPRSP